MLQIWGWIYLLGLKKLYANWKMDEDGQRTTPGISHFLNTAQSKMQVHDSSCNLIFVFEICLEGTVRFLEQMRNRQQNWPHNSTTLQVELVAWQQQSQPSTVGFLKWGYPSLSSRFLHYKPPILGFSHGTPPPAVLQRLVGLPPWHGQAARASEGRVISADPTDVDGWMGGILTVYTSVLPIYTHTYKMDGLLSITPFADIWSSSKQISIMKK